MNPRRRAWLLALPTLAAGPGLAQAQGYSNDKRSDKQNDNRSGNPDDDRIQRGRTLRFPRDHGAHPGSRTEWWYATGWLRAAGDDALLGFQLTFFRSRTGLAVGHPSRFAARQLLFAHAAVTDPARKVHRHADRLARWSGADDPALRSRAGLQDTAVALDGWHFTRRAADGAQISAQNSAQNGGRYEGLVTSSDFRLELQLTPTQPLLLQGDAGFSRKGPDESQASHYYSQPQLAARARVLIDGRARDAAGRAWLDHEWSDELLHPQAVGWDWIGINLDDGRALTAFRLRRADGTALWAGGSLRAPGGPVQAFGPESVRFEPGRRWRSPASNASYPVEWQIDTPAGRFAVRTLMDAQELDGRASTGTVYWEGLSELLDGSGRRIGLGYLEMTGYAGTLRL